MKRISILLLFFLIGQRCFATEWAWYYVYVQTEYLQGPWKRTDLLYESKQYVYLHPIQCEELFGSESSDLANAIFSRLKEENPERYAFPSKLSLVNDTVVVSTKEIIPELEAVKNELTASFILNNFEAVKIVQGNQSNLYLLKDISVPYMDLVGASTKGLATDTVPQEVPNIKQDSVFTNTPIQPSDNTEQTNSLITILLFISLGTNVLLVALLMRKRK